ncbi:MAG: protein kinase [Planctomycetota bacterium]|nr:protein kinase [Planctomycetota bacterium]
MQRLTHLCLCRPRDLRRSRSRVRRLAHGLPAFDSVWIDALVQLNKLTPFQARVLESSSPDELSVGPCVLLRELGQRGTTFLARRRTSHERCVLKFISLPGQTAAPLNFAKYQRCEVPQVMHESPDDAAKSLAAFFSHHTGLRHPSVVIPHSSIQHGGRLISISRFVDGVSLRELLVRRGRFSGSIAMAVLRQLVDGLAALEQAGTVHGELRASKVRLTKDGRAVLVDTGIRRTIRPVLSVPIGLHINECEGIAPELIGTRREPDARSELFALGCLLWSLLAGRSPFPTGDPLAKLASLRSKRIPDVREWAPETPAPLAECLLNLTAFEREQRPASFAELREQIGWPKQTDRGKLSRFRESFNHAAPAIATPIPDDGRSAVQRVMVAACLMLMCLVGAMAVWDWPSQDQLLSIRARVIHQLGIEDEERESIETPAAEPNEPHDRSSFPAIESDGVIRLASDQPYRATAVSAVGSVTLIGTGKAVAIVLVDQPMSVTGHDVRFENVEFRGTSETIDQLVQVSSHTLHVRDCRFVSLPVATESSKSRFISGIKWSPAEGALIQQSRVRCVGSVFVNVGAAMEFTTAAGAIQFENSLVLNSKCMIGLHSDARQAATDVRAQRVTLRDVDALLAITSGENGANPVRLALDSCVLALDPDQGSLVQFVGRRLPKGETALVLISAERTILATDAPTATWLAAEQGTPTMLINSNLVGATGLGRESIEFTGPPELPKKNSTIKTPRADELGIE